MSDIYILDITSIDKNVDEIVKTLPPIRQEKIRNFRFEKDKLLSLGVGLLMKTYIDGEIKYSYDGKPYIEDNNKYLSASHSGKYAVLAVSDSPIGVDIQEEVPYDVYLRRLNKTFSSIYVDKKMNFFASWTILESFSKLIGDGVYSHLHDKVKLEPSKLIIGNETFSFIFNKFNECYLGAVSSKINEKFDIHTVEFKDLYLEK